ncbi:MAG: glycosyltransferase [Deltaproteobacteria bacterium]|nr:glycosyltransferase [Deltaproteobacteria bacterium]
MRFVMFYHSLISDWNHGNAHFLRGIATELLFRGHEVDVYEPEDSWSYANLTAACNEATGLFESKYPWLKSRRYALDKIDLEAVVSEADIVIVHEWNDHELVKKLGELRARSTSFKLFFHDTHHRSLTEPESMEAYDLSNYDGVLAFGEVIRDLYLRRGWTDRAWTWHEAADLRTFRPLEAEKQGDLVWVGNWGDGERSAELSECLLEPVKSLGLKARIHGVRYPDEALARLEDAGVEYAGWAPNFDVPRIFASFKCTVHVPRRPYAEMLAGIPTIRVFEALACGIPLVSAPWDDAEGLFTPGKDFLVARDGVQMEKHLKDLTNDAAMRRELAEAGLAAIQGRHSCSHRTDELLAICEELNGGMIAI